jgi:hypothetical protein
MVLGCRDGRRTTDERRTLPAKVSETISIAKSGGKNGRGRKENQRACWAGLGIGIGIRIWGRTGLAVAAADVAHGLVVAVLGRVVADAERGGTEGFCELVWGAAASVVGRRKKMVLERDHFADEAFEWASNVGSGCWCWCWCW